MKLRKSSNIKSLPREMLAEILKHAASNSITDFVNAQISCKAFLGASNDYQILENVSMANINFVPWYKCEKIFLKKCKDAKNSEALYRKGMINCFNRRKLESGLCYLKKAAEKGHFEAKYTYGIILICLGGELKRQGLQIVSSLDRTSSNTRFKIASCRSKTENMLSSMWVYVSLDRPKESANNAKLNCKCDDIITPRPNQWEASNNLHDNLPCCDSCFWDHEATLFSNMLRKYLINKVQ
ncbi:putative F-box protein At1g67623 [Herrania umbratica]|uniref:F-box protein At1g67623 n=1 Tax=Herrania umbratica TaxID=108875 RepID=A0A6J1B6U2_9ROSI|nr:putative F-box protein At1g67623 [Herrania umbratica]